MDNFFQEKNKELRPKLHFICQIEFSTCYHNFYDFYWKEILKLALLTKIQIFLQMLYAFDKKKFKNLVKGYLSNEIFEKNQLLCWLLPKKYSGIFENFWPVRIYTKIFCLLTKLKFP